MKNIIEIAKQAKAEADRDGDNWADYVDAALNDAGIKTNETVAREMANAGKTDVVAVLKDGRVIECWADGTWHISRLVALPGGEWGTK